MDSNHCAEDGFLVGARWPVPEQAEEFHHPGLAGIIGCSRLVCSSCGTVVRQRSGVMPLGDANLIAHLPALTEALDWTALPFLVANRLVEDHRLYACRCRTWLETSFHSLHDPDPDPLQDPDLPWACSGHPRVRLPFDLDGVIIGPATDVAGLVRRSFAGWSPEQARPREREFGGAWIDKLYVLLTGEESARLVALGAAACLTDPDPRVRACALRFYIDFPTAAGGEELVQLAAGPRDLFRGIANPVYGRAATLEDSLLAALDARLAVGEQEGPDDDA